jgi:hypothetical protein
MLMMEVEMVIVVVVVDMFVKGSKVTQCTVGTNHVSTHHYYYYYYYSGCCCCCCGGGYDDSIVVVVVEDIDHNTSKFDDITVPVMILMCWTNIPIYIPVDTIEVS